MDRLGWVARVTLAAAQLMLIIDVVVANIALHLPRRLLVIWSLLVAADADTSTQRATA